MVERASVQRIGQKGRLCHRWWLKGQRPPGRRDRRFAWAYLFAAVAPASGAEVALVLPEATTRTMNLFLATLSHSLPDDVPAVLVLDRAAWHRPGGALQVPANVTLVHLPSYAPELNPVERSIGVGAPDRRLYLRTLLEPAGVRGLSGHRRCLLRRLEPPRRRARPSPLLVLSALNPKSHFIGSAV